MIELQSTIFGSGSVESSVYPYIRLFSGEMNLIFLVCFCTGALVATVDAKVSGLNEVHSCQTFYKKKKNKFGARINLFVWAEQLSSRTSFLEEFVLNRCGSRIPRKRKGQ